MTPKEKAKQLLQRFYFSLPNNGSLSDGINCCDDRWNEGKQCALITVSEILKLEPPELSYLEPFSKSWWQEVELEIKKL